MVEIPEVRYADAGGVRLAYQDIGAGDPIVVVPALLSNLEVMWEHECYRRILELARRNHRLVIFDKRGIGLSDRFDRAPTLDERMSDIVAVMDTVGLERASLAGTSEGGLMAQQFAVRHPERVERLILINAPVPSTLLRRARELGGAAHRPWEEIRRDWEAVASSWGEDAGPFVELASPSRVEDEAFVRWGNRLNRLTATPAGFRRQLESIVSMDTSGLRPSEIEAPTMVIQVARDRVVGVGNGRALAEAIPNADYLEVDGADHFWVSLDNWREIMDAQIEFVTGVAPTSRTERVFATVLFTDIVDSTPTLAARGDQQWRSAIESHDRLAHRTVAEHGGRVVKSTGDGILATFPIPSAATRAARTFRSELSALDISIRAGLHAGEIEVHENADISGIAVNVAARIERAATRGSIYVSRIVRDMLTGSDLECVDRDDHELEGIDGSMRLYELV